MSTQKLHGKRSFTGNHPLLPAMGPTLAPFSPEVPTYNLLKWTFGRGSVIWKIWPAVLLHTLFAACIVYAWDATGRSLQIPNVMLTVMGVVIGFVISYRAMSGYDRYWMGRTAWADVIRNARTMGRLIWYHVPPRLSPGAGVRSPQELGKVMAEKRMALDLVEAFAVALKHHLRGEVGIYFQDLYHLVRPLHDVGTRSSSISSPHLIQFLPRQFQDPSDPHPTVASAAPAAPTSTSMSTSTSTSAGPSSSTLAPPSASASGVSTSTSTSPSPQTHAAKRPAAPAPAPGTNSGAAASDTSLHHHQALLPASNPAPEQGVLRRVSPDVIPFAGVFTGVAAWVRGFWAQRKAEVEGRRSRVRVFFMGENLPEEVLRCLSEWISVLEERGTVPGTSLGSMLGGIQTFEISLATLEQILTTPLPFVYSVHIRVVWLYLFMLPLQLVSDFGWHTVPAVAVGAFVYLGFVAAGEEIEQPFGYDDNDLDLDMYCREIIRQDLQSLKKAPCQNAWFPPSASVTGRPHTAAPAEHSYLAPDSTSTSTSNGNAGSMRGYGGNMFRASLASLSDTASIQEESETETETEEDVDAGTRGGETQGREAELVDVR
ncbi:Bestrophin, RFP-TM, chloride channel-domain-containing protein [Mycena epipterygia]|nr:Bestrophin, RFP-TM, chloride channel-domain-containing protein [Mycena epipterygia]